MKTKKIMVALLAFGAYFSGNAQTWTPNTLNLTDAISRTGALTINSPTTTNTLTLNNSSISASNFLTGMYVGGTGPSYSLTPTGLTFLRTQYQGSTSSTTISSGLININASEANSNTFTSGSSGVTSLTINGYGDLTTKGNINAISNQVNAGRVYIGSTTATQIGQYGLGYVAITKDATAKAIWVEDARTTPSKPIFSVMGDGQVNGNSFYGSTVHLSSLTNWGIGYYASAGDVTARPIYIEDASGNSIFSVFGNGMVNAKTIKTGELRVIASPNMNTPYWADYVFAKDYKLRPLKDVEAFINANSHLPEVPSTAEVAKEGIDVMKMDATLLKKVEELTLYMIQQQKEIEALKAQVNSNK